MSSAGSRDGRADGGPGAAGRHAVRDTVAVRMDVAAPDSATTALLIAPHRLVEAGPDARRTATPLCARRRTGPLARRGIEE
ncbi:hypothetical protein [Streptomyces pratensis]|uniref:hypothetical protein n=1 Tax=Streptomyces pratensis TaxID=1169025 RepID=UPI001933CDFD|nr:hypothetical protein [Streptomyces pratensis]